MRQLRWLAVGLFFVVGIPAWSDDGANTMSPQLRQASPATAGAGEAASSSDDEEKITVYRTKTGKKYHRSSCQYLKKSKYKLSLKDAKARGLSPCSVCKPPR